MADPMQQARELLAETLDAIADDTRYHALNGEQHDHLREAAAALRAAPEVTDEMVEAAHAAYWAHPDDSGEDRPCIRAALEAALAARPQGMNNG